MEYDHSGFDREVVCGLCRAARGRPTSGGDRGWPRHGRRADVNKPVAARRLSPNLHFARSPLVWERETPRKPGLVANNARFGGASKPCRNLPPHEIAGKTATPRGRHSRKVQPNEGRCP